MSNDFDWDNEGNTSEDDNVSEYDMLSSTYKEGHIAPQQQMVEPEEEVLQQIEDESAFELDHDESNVVYNARLRLEQARLYEMLINHNMFDGVDASPEAIECVQNEIKEFIIERLEILLRLREVKPKVNPETIEIELPFNEIEIEFLKALSYKGTRGASANYSESVRDAATTTSELKPISSSGGKTGLKKLVQSNPTAKKVTTVKRKTPAKKAEQALRTKAKKKPQRKIKDNINNKVIKRSLVVQKMTEGEAEDIARQDMDAMKKRGKWGKMTSAEKAKEITRVNAKHAKTEVTDKLPIPDAASLTTHYMAQQARNSHSGDKGKINNMISNILIQKKSRQ